MKTRRPRRRRPRPRWWRWLGWGLAGLAGLAFLGRRPTSRPSRQPLPPEDAGLPLDLVSDAAISWIPGPGGSLRIAEVHPEASTAVVFVHGLGGRLEHWSPQLAALGPAVRGVAFDLPGHGGSDGDGYTIAALAGALGAVVEGLALRRPLLAAHSIGALAGLDYAGRHPGRIAGVLLVDASGDQSALPEADRRQYLEALRKDPHGELAWNFRQFLGDARPEVADRVLEDAGELSAEVIVGVLESAVCYSPLEALDRFPGPLRAVVSERNDLPTSLHRLRPDIPCRLLTGASHWLMMDRPEEVWEELVELFEDVR